LVEVDLDGQHVKGWIEPEQQASRTGLVRVQVGSKTLVRHVDRLWPLNDAARYWLDRQVATAGAHSSSLTWPSPEEAERLRAAWEERKAALQAGDPSSEDE
jgi:hypothetical protein